MVVVLTYFMHLHFLKIHSAWTFVPGDCSIFSSLRLAASVAVLSHVRGHEGINKFLITEHPNLPSNFISSWLKRFLSTGFSDASNFMIFFSHFLRKLHILGQSNKTTFIRGAVHIAYFFILGLLFFKCTLTYVVHA